MTETETMDIATAEAETEMLEQADVTVETTEDETVTDTAETEAEEETKAAAEKPQKLRELSDEETEDLLRLLEALLFTASDLVTLSDLQPFFPPQTPIAMLLERLEQQYAERGINLVQRGTGWGFRTSPDLGERLQIRKSETKPMSRPIIETLAIIAYHQPITKAEIEQVRGVSVGKNIMETLVEQNLIKPGKRREAIGRPLTWITTQQFLDAFSLTSLKDLPNLQEMKDQGLLTVTPPNFNLQPSLGLEDEEGHNADEQDAEDQDDLDMPDEAVVINEETLADEDESDYDDEAAKREQLAQGDV